MKNYYLSLLPLLFHPSITMADTQTDLSQLESEANEIAMEFVSRLKPQLKQAIQSGGFAHAVEICSSTSPKIAADLSKKTGWRVKRVSLKPRNTSSATPDHYEEFVLNTFDQRVRQDPTVENLTQHDVVDNQFRFLKAQRVEGLCLTCHGTAVTDEISTKIQLLYPEDIAMNYQLGQVRGAISLSLPILAPSD